MDGAGALLVFAGDFGAFAGAGAFFGLFARGFAGEAARTGIVESAVNGLQRDDAV